MRRRIAAAAASTTILGAALLVPGLPAVAAEPDQRTVTVDLDEVVQEDYLGIGVNVIPWSLMPGTADYGYDDADWEVDVERILTLQPKVVRLWFQIDWMEQEKGVYDFESERMQAFYRYLDAFQQAGTEVELNFGWKVGESVHDWFLYPGVTKPYESAPGDLVAYGHSASALLDELINARGYDNIDYLTFYNEPNGSWDFEGPADQKAYYAAMARQVHDQLIEDGLRDEVEIWGPEEVNAPDWTQYMAENASDVFDQYSFHLYGESYELMGEAIDQRREFIGDAPLNLSEMGWTNPGTSVWETGYANYIIRSANSNVHSNLIWQLNGVMTDDPAGDTNGAFNLWDSLVLGLEPTAAFPEAGLLMRYVPEHSTVLGTTVSDDDIRATAFRDQDGELTVLVETQDGTEKDVRVEFTGGDVTDDFHRFVFNDELMQTDDNALLPASTGTLTPASNALSDEFDDQNSFAIYTTAAPATQVAMTPAQSTIAGGTQTTLQAEVIDGPSDAEVTWSVIGDDNGSVDADGVFTAPDVETERTVAVRGTVSDGVYGVAQITVTPASRAGVADAPVFSLTPGVYDSVEAVRLTSGTAGAEIHYTTDGSEPTAESPLYTGQIMLQPLQTVYLRAIAVADGLADSGITSRLYKVRGVQNAPDGYTFCQYEDGGRCEFEGEASVVFGSEGLFSYGTFTDGVECTAASFPSNPNPDAEDNRCFFSTEIPETDPVVTIYNAGFENPATSGTANGPMVNGWTFSARAGIQHNDSVFNPASPAPQGERTAYLKTDSGLGSRLDQTVVFPAGTYALTFAGAIRTDYGGAQEWDVLIDDTVLGHYAPAGGTYEFFETEAIELEAGEHTISFVATTTDGDNTGFVDDVKVVAVEDETPDETKPVATLVTPTTAGPYAQLALQVDATDDRGLDRIVANIYRDGTLVKSTQTAVKGATSGSHSAAVTLPDGAYTIRYNASDLAGNIAKTGSFAVTVDATAPTVTVKEGAAFTVPSGDGYRKVSFKLHDVGKIDRLTLNGVVKDLTDNAWSDLNGVKPGAFGAVAGANTLVVYDLAGNAQTIEFVLVP